MRWLLLLIVLAGCSELPAENASNPTQPLYDGEEAESDQGYGASSAEVSYDCDELPHPEKWYGYGDGSLWCVLEGGSSGSGGTAVVPGNSLYDHYAGRNGSAGHARDTAITGNVLVSCWSAACYADVTMTIRANGTDVATLSKAEPVVGTILDSGTWIVLEGTLDTAIAPGGVLEADVSVAGVGALMLRGYSGDRAPWFSIGD